MSGSLQAFKDSADDEFGDDDHVGRQEHGEAQNQDTQEEDDLKDKHQHYKIVQIEVDESISHQIHSQSDHHEQDPLHQCGPKFLELLLSGDAALGPKTALPWTDIKNEDQMVEMILNILIKNNICQRITLNLKQSLTVVCKEGCDLKLLVEFFENHFQEFKSLEKHQFRYFQLLQFYIITPSALDFIEERRKCCKNTKNKHKPVEEAEEDGQNDPALAVLTSTKSSEGLVPKHECDDSGLDQFILQFRQSYSLWQEHPLDTFSKKILDLYEWKHIGDKLLLLRDLAIIFTCQSKKIFAGRREIYKAILRIVNEETTVAEAELILCIDDIRSRCHKEEEVEAFIISSGYQSFVRDEIVTQLKACIQCQNSRVCRQRNRQKKRATKDDLGINAPVKRRKLKKNLSPSSSSC